MTRTPDLFTEPGPYFNTTSEKGATLRLYRRKAAIQDERILAIMQDLGIASPSQVHRAIGQSCPLTSVRRALTNLTSAGKLEKLDSKVAGAYGRNEHLWKVVTP